MKRLALFLILIVMLLSACGGRIAPNYPPVRSAISSELPDSWKWNGKNAPVVMTGEGYKGFLAQWHDPVALLGQARFMDANGSKTAHQEIKDMETLINDDLAPLRVAVFFSEGELRLYRKGVLEIVFSNGTSIPDEGVVVFAGSNRSEQTGKYDSRKDRINLDKTWEPRGEPVYLLILMPRNYLGQRVVSIRLSEAQSTETITLKNERR
ncbi:MAG: hypothetical protein PHO91_03515 [Patescibacteria group bacterium]|nr:hypothetical protein [Patescibacteria group bacterium]